MEVTVLTENVEHLISVDSVANVTLVVAFPLLVRVSGLERHDSQ